MVVHIFLFILFFSLLIWHNKHNTFFINSGLTIKQNFFLFVLKVTIGILYIYIDQNFIYGGDLDTFYTESIYETNFKTCPKIGKYHTTYKKYLVA